MRNSAKLIIPPPPQSIGRTSIFLLAAALASAGLSAGAVAQQASWQDIAVQAQQNAARDQILANAVIANLQAEIADLKAQIAKMPPPPEPPK
jgi:cell division protein FtsB